MAVMGLSVFSFFPTASAKVIKAQETAIATCIKKSGLCLPVFVCCLPAATTPIALALQSRQRPVAQVRAAAEVRAIKVS